MNIVNICPTCHKSISATALVDIIVTYREDLTRNEIYEQGWHKECYPSAAPSLLAALTEGIGIPANSDFADDLETIAGQLEDRLPVYAEKIREKAQAIRAALAAVRGEPVNEAYLARYDYAGDMRD